MSDKIRYFLLGIGTMWFFFILGGVIRLVYDLLS